MLCFEFMDMAQQAYSMLPFPNIGRPTPCLTLLSALRTETLWSPQVQTESGKGKNQLDYLAVL